jgi:hypothetical protein
MVFLSHFLIVFPVLFFSSVFILNPSLSPCGLAQEAARVAGFCFVKLSWALC